MPTKILYRSLMVGTGKIELRDYDFYDGQIILDEIQVAFDDTIREEHRKRLILAVEENIKKKNAKHFAEIKKLEDFKENLMVLEHKD